MASSSKLPLGIAKPGGLGALAMTVVPPPVTAPATIEYLKASDTPSTSAQVGQGRVVGDGGEQGRAIVQDRRAQIGETG